MKKVKDINQIKSSLTDSYKLLDEIKQERANHSELEANLSLLNRHIELLEGAVHTLSQEEHNRNDETQTLQDSLKSLESILIEMKLELSDIKNILIKQQKDHNSNQQVSPTNSRVPMQKTITQQTPVTNYRHLQSLMNNSSMVQTPKKKH
ncbi:hypothetical protein [Aquisalibacillus elongatus]|uniref:Uncharacterized protein n=1 Tax=Aquisalibacillus elongatus TaxID=485577 RepID=A0A3N5B4A7_9BACI|nr:hypothetical protein [Aquisalibacillus elongatus]RPF52153.1 hypothetical protein EDC24_2143 [Aquisalibacillus elongatus]